MSEAAYKLLVNRPFVFIPAKNEEKTIQQVIANIRQEVERVVGKPAVILVGSDGSSDATVYLARQAGAIVLEHLHSVGLGNNFKSGLNMAIAMGSDLLLTIDADGQFSSRDAEKLITPILEGKSDMTTGSRFKEGSMLSGIPPVKHWGNARMSALISWITQKQFSDVSCGYRVYSREAMLRLNLFGGFTYTQEVMLSLAYQELRILEIPISVEYFEARISRIASNIPNYAVQTIKIIVKSLLYYRPMWAMARLAAVFAIPAFTILILMGIRFLMTGEISPYKYVAVLSVISIFLSLACFLTGIFLQLYSRVQKNLDLLLYYEKRRSTSSS
jgi:glycosyltransferase involved in cell wall biosynthesis